MENLETPDINKINGDNPFVTAPEVSLGKNALIYGLILGAITVVYSIILWLFGQTTNKALGYVNLIFSAGVMFYATKEYRDKQLDGYMMYGTAFTSNFLIGLYSCIIGAVYTFFLYQFIDPGLINTMKDVTEAAMQKNPSLSQEQIEQAMATTSKFMTPGIITVFAFIFGAIFSAILALLVSIFHKKEKSLL